MRMARSTPAQNPRGPASRTRRRGFAHVDGRGACRGRSVPPWSGSLASRVLPCRSGGGPAAPSRLPRHTSRRRCRPQSGTMAFASDGSSWLALAGTLALAACGGAANRRSPPACPSRGILRRRRRPHPLPPRPAGTSPAMGASTAGRRRRRCERGDERRIDVTMLALRLERRAAGPERPRRRHCPGSSPSSRRASGSWPTSSFIEHGHVPRQHRPRCEIASNAVNLSLPVGGEARDRDRLYDLLRPDRGGLRAQSAARAALKRPGRRGTGSAQA